MYSATAILASLAYLGLVTAQKCVRAPGDLFADGSLAVRAPGLNQVVAAGTPFTIKWDKSSSINLVSIQLLLGPSINNGPLSCIAENIPDTGSFVWTPSNDLVSYGNSNYGLKIISDTGDKHGTYYFQYSTQFGISNPKIESSLSNSASKTTIGEHSGHTESSSGTFTPTSQFAHATHTTSSHSRSSVLVIPSSGFPTASKNTTHGITPSYGANMIASTGGIKNSTAFIKPTTFVGKPTSLASVTSVAIQTASTLPLTQTPSLTKSSVATTSPSAAAVSMVAGGILAGLGGLAALVL